MEIVETLVFTRQIMELIPDDEYAVLQLDLAARPDLGVLIPGGGGIRKIRWGRAERGKRGGVRVIYYWHVSGERIYMLAAYAKNAQDNLTARQLKVLRQRVKEEFGRE